MCLDLGVQPLGCSGRDYHSGDKAPTPKLPRLFRKGFFEEPFIFVY
jgi:hypothetical protein